MLKGIIFTVNGSTSSCDFKSGYEVVPPPAILLIVFVDTFNFNMTLPLQIYKLFLLSTSRDLTASSANLKLKGAVELFVELQGATPAAPTTRTGRLFVVLIIGPGVLGE